MIRRVNKSVVSATTKWCCAGSIALNPFAVGSATGSSSVGTLHGSPLFPNSVSGDGVRFFSTNTTFSGDRRVRTKGSSNSKSAKKEQIQEQGGGGGEASRDETKRRTKKGKMTVVRGEQPISTNNKGKRQRSSKLSTTKKLGAKQTNNVVGATTATTTTPHTATSTNTTNTTATSTATDDFATAMREQLSKSVVASLEVPLRKAVANTTLKQTLRQQEKLRRRQWLASEQHAQFMRELQRGERSAAGDAGKETNDEVGTEKSPAAAATVSPTKVLDDTTTNPSKRLQRNYYYRKARDFDAAVRAAKLKMEAKLAAASLGEAGKTGDQSAASPPKNDPCSSA